MTGTTELNHLSANPDDLPTDPEEIAKLLGGGENNQDDTGASAPAGDSSNAKPQGATETDGKLKGEPETQAEAEDVLAKDGKHVLPYAVLKDAREREQEARRVATEAQARVEELQRKLEDIQSGKPVVELDKASDHNSDAVVQELDTAIKDLEGEVPQLAKVLSGFKSVVTQLQARVNEQNGVIQTVEADRKARAADHSRTLQEQVQDAIDSHPTLRYLDAAKGKDDAAMNRWNSIAALDETFRAVDKDGRPLHADYLKLPLAERFAKCVKADIAMNGDIPIPAEYQSSEAIQRAAQKAVEKAGSFKPNTLADLPGGEPPATNELNFETMDATQIGELAIHDPAAFERALSRFA